MTQENEFSCLQPTTHGGKNKRGERARTPPFDHPAERAREENDLIFQFSLPSERERDGARITEHSSAPPSDSEVFRVGIRFIADADFGSWLSNLAGTKLGRSSVRPPLHTYITFWTSLGVEKKIRVSIGSK